MATIRRFACLILLSCLALPGLAANSSPVGIWQQVDDDSGKVTSLIRIGQTNGALTGTVIKVMNMSAKAVARDGSPPKCTQCDGARHDQPIEGMEIMWGLRPDGDEWSGGHILDPSSGKIYKVKLQLTDQGRKLKVRGYIGFSLLGRTQVWLRTQP